MHDFADREAYAAREAEGDPPARPEGAPDHSFGTTSRIEVSDTISMKHGIILHAPSVSAPQAAAAENRGPGELGSVTQLKRGAALPPSRL